MPKQVAIRWTIGDVSPRGYQTLALSIQSAHKIFGAEAAYAVTVNTVEVSAAQARTGKAARLVSWYQADKQTPAWLVPYLAPNYAEGVAWKLAPCRLFPGSHELSLDNDVVFWTLPESIKAWLQDADSCLLAEDVAPCFGQFAHLCGPEPRNSGIRGFPPGFDFEAEIRRILESHPVVMSSELDEQGLQVLALSRGKHRVVRTGEVTICGAFPPHLPYLGRCGAHFVGVNAKKMPWEYLGRSGEQYAHENWDRHRPAVTEFVSAARPAALNGTF